MKPNKNRVVKVRVIEPTYLNAEDVITLKDKWVLCQITSMSSGSKRDTPFVKFFLSLLNCEDTKLNNVVSMKRASILIDSDDFGSIVEELGWSPAQDFVGKQLYVKWGLKDNTIVAEQITVPVDKVRKKRVSTKT